MFGFFFDLFVLAIVIGLYFLPSIVGHRKRNFRAIFWLNFLAGWTVAGWIVALVWALTKDPADSGAPPPPPALLCRGCGKYSPFGSKFCGVCGLQFP